jgi:hypothetical protein
VLRGIAFLVKCPDIRQQIRDPLFCRLGRKRFERPVSILHRTAAFCKNFEAPHTNYDFMRRMKSVSLPFSVRTFPSSS